MASAERELGAFMRAVSEMFGAEHTPRAADDWLDEFERIDTLPQTRSDFGSVTIAAAARLATALTNDRQSGSLSGPSRSRHKAGDRKYHSDKSKESKEMEDNELVKSSFSATINAPIEKVDIPSWCFTLPESEYQWCSPAHCSAGATTSPDGRRMSINVEILGGSLIVEHYIEEVARPDHLRLVSTSDVFTPAGRTNIGVVWDLAAKKIDDKTCEFTNTIQTCATPELLDFLGKQGTPLDVFRSAHKPIAVAHNQQETPMFAKSIERHALREG